MRLRVDKIPDGLPFRYRYASGGNCNCTWAKTGEMYRTKSNVYCHTVLVSTCPQHADMRLGLSNGHPPTGDGEIDDLALALEQRFA